MSIRTRLQRQAHRIALARDLMAIGARRRDSLKIGLLALAQPLRARSRWRHEPVDLCLADGEQRACFAAIGRTDLEVAREIFVNDEYELPDGDAPLTILDLGAHIGLASIHFANRFPSARIVAVEADPELIPTLEQNVSGHQVTVVHAAVSAASGRRAFYRSDDSWSNSVQRTRQGQEQVEVPAMTLEEICRMVGFESVSLMKIDIEGAEWEVLADGVPDFVEAVIGEAHQVDGGDARKVLDWVARDRCIDIRRADSSRAVFFASSRCSRDGTPLLAAAGQLSTLL